MTAPAPAPKAPVEAKVKWASVGTYIAATAGLAILQAVGDAELIAALPAVIEPFVLALVPAATSFLTGYKTRHTPRT